MSLVKVIKKENKIIYKILGIKFSKMRKTNIEDIIERIDRVERLIKADNNLIFKYLSGGIELHPCYGMERVVFDNYKDVLINYDLYPDFFREHIYRYLFATQYIEDQDTVLDLASGSGYGTKILAQKAPKGKIIGADIAQYAVDFANRLNTNERLSYIKADALAKESFGNNSFNKIVSFETLEHVPEVSMEQMILNFYNWLKPGGLFIGSTPNEEAQPYIIDGKITNEYHCKHYTKAEILKILQNVGFKNIEIYFQIGLDKFEPENINNRGLYLVFKTEK